MPAAARVLTIGNFDAVHLGHQALISQARRRAGSGGRVTALVFDPHPASTLRPGAAPPRLTSWTRRRDLLAAAGVDEVVRLEPTSAFLGTSPEAFIASVAAEHAPDALLEGPDFRFGHARRGDIALLRRLGGQHGFEVIVVDAVEAPLDDHTLVTVSSSLVRWLLAHGRVRDAARLLGRPYELRGPVRAGDRRGRQLGTPTANVEADAMLPGRGVYFGQATSPDGRWFPAAINVGVKPTFPGAAPGCEAHLVGADLPLDDYGWECRIRFLGFLRSEMRFDGAPAVAAQIRRDIERTRDLLAGHALAS